MQRVGRYEVEGNRAQSASMELFHSKVPIFRSVLHSWTEKVWHGMAVRLRDDEFIEALGLQSVQVGDN